MKPILENDTTSLTKIDYHYDYLSTTNLLTFIFAMKYIISVDNNPLAALPTLLGTSFMAISNRQRGRASASKLKPSEGA